MLTAKRLIIFKPKKAGTLFEVVKKTNSIFLQPSVAF